MTGFGSEGSYGRGDLAAAWFARGQVALTDVQITVLVQNPKAGGILPQEKIPGQATSQLCYYCRALSRDREVLVRVICSR